MTNATDMPGNTGTTNDTETPRRSVNTPSETEQNRKDREEKQKHPASENELESSQDRNPVPPESTAP